MSQLPLPTRNFQQLLTLSPGTTANLSNNTEMGRGDVNIDVNGQRATSNNVLVDGTQVMSPGTNSTPNISVPSPDAIQEFIVQTSMYDASQGRNSGGNVAVVTKSGTNNFHGSAYEFFRNRVLNANDFFLNRNGVKKPVLNRNQFGATLGGPIIKDKTFFFVSYQGTRERNGMSQTNSVNFPFIPAGLTDDRSDATLAAWSTGMGVSALNPITKTFLQKKLPSGQWAIPSAAANSSVVGALINTPVSGISRFTEDQFIVNIDQSIGQKNKLSGKFFFSDTPQYQSIFNFVGANAYEVPGYGGFIDFHNRVLTISDTHIFSSQLINQFHAGYSRINGPSHPEEPFKASDFGINNPLCTTADTRFCGMPTVQVGAYGAAVMTIGSTTLADQRSTTQTFEWGDMLSYTHGRHLLRFGGDVRRYRVDFFFNFFSRGLITFANWPDFLRGKINLGYLGNGLRSRNYRATDLDMYVQDDYRVTDSLTLNFGMRIGRNGGISDTHNRLVNFDPSLYAASSLPCTIAAPCLQPNGLLTGLHQLNPSDWNAAPRFGFAWKPMANGKTVVRGGFGVYFDRFSTRVANLQIFNYPYDLVGVGIDNFLDPTHISSFMNPFPNLAGLTFPLTAKIPSPVPFYMAGFSLGVPTPIAGLYVDPDFRTPYVYQYNFGIQHEIAKDLLVEIGYVGSKGTKLINVYTFNQGPSGTSPYGKPPYPTATSAFSTNKVLNGFQQARTDALSHYNSLQASVTKRFGKGLQFLAAYTWGKSIDDVSGQPTNEFAALAGDQQNRAANRAVSDFDRPHRFVFSGTYDLPKFYNGDSGFAKRVVNGWQTGGVMTLQSGTPFSIICTTAGSSAIYSRADLVAGVSPHVGGSTESRLNGYFNPAAFKSICTGDAPYGTSPRNFLRGPGQRNVDLSIVKFIPVTERTKMEFRTEMFNAFNFVNFANPVNTFAWSLTPGASTYPLLGKIINTATGPRVIQFALKLSF